MMKRIIALLLSLVLLLGTLSGCAEGHFRFKNDTSLTRGQWVDVLAKSFGMDDYEKDTPYLSDVSSDDSIFKSVQSCYEWGVLRDTPKKLKKHSGATLEFVVTTAVYATGADISSYEGKNDIEKAINYAEANNIVAQGLNYSKWATGQQCNDILVAAQDAYLNQEITPIDKVVINTSVSDERKTDAIKSVGNSEYLFNGKKPSVGDVFIAPGTKENPDGVAIKITDVIDNGDGTYSVRTTTPELHEVFDEIEYAGVVVPEIDDIIPASGVTISGLTSSNVSPVSYQPSDTGFTNLSHTNTNTAKVVNLSNTTNGSNGFTTLEHSNNYDVVPLGIGTSKKDALSFTASLNLTKGTVSLSPQWGNKSIEIQQLLTGSPIAGSEAGQWFEKKSVFPDKTLFGPDAYSNDEAIDAYKKGVINADELREALYGMQDKNGIEKIPNITNKFSGGYEIIGSISITDLYIVPTYKLKTAKVLGIDTGIPTGISNFSIETNYGASVSLSVKGKIENELTVCSIPVTLGGVGTLTLDIVLYAELNGEIAVKASISNNTKTEYSSGKTKKTSKQDSSTRVEAELELEAGPKLDAKISVCTIPLVNASVSAAIQVKASGGIELSAEWTETEEVFVIDRKTAITYGVEGHIPIVKIKIGSDKSTLANKLNISFSWTIVGSEGSNAPFTAAKFDILPEEEIVIWQEHLELPKDPNEEIEDNSENSNTNSDNGLGGNMNISSYYIHLDEGESIAVDLEYPDNYSADDFKWESSDTSIVTVKNGELKAKKAGSATITAKSKDGKYYANCAVYVGSEQNDRFEGLE
ncbi:MAG TPA: hypothetical protein DD413_04190 [Ruminococcus sp.]|nr:hypothetical protein [Ruminococcus sp.]